MTRECNIALDCREFVNDKVVEKLCYVNVDFSSESNFCDCDSLLGFVGEECGESGSQAEFLRLSSILILLGLFVLIGWNIWNIAKAVDGWRSQNKRKRKGLKAPSIAKYRAPLSLFYISMAMLGITLDRVLLLRAMFTNDHFVLGSRNFAIGGSSDAVLPETQSLQDICISLSFTSMLVGVLLIALYLKEVAAAIMGQTLNWRRVYVQVAIEFTATLLLVIFDLFQLAGMVSLIRVALSVYIIVVVTNSRREVVKAMKPLEYHSHQKKEENLFLPLVNKVYTLTVLNLSLFASLSTIYFFSIRFAYSSTVPGEINFSSILYLSLVLLILSQITVVLFFTTKFLTNPSLATESRDFTTGNDLEVIYHEPARRVSLSSPHVEGSVVKVAKTKQKKVSLLQFRTSSVNSSNSSNRLSLSNANFTGVVRAKKKQDIVV